ncbi:hypothetical protein KGY64_00890 [Candidatus Bipolaricaulota bacterium]|nr:hypothetical protein [Candidatus Bipolaricaulota bacterium]
MAVEYENEIGIEYILQKPEDDDDPDSYFFSSRDVGERVEELPGGYEVYEDPEHEVFLVQEGGDPVPEEDVATVRGALEDIDHLNEYENLYRVETFDDSIWVYLTDDTPETITDVINWFPEEEERILDEISRGNFTYSAYLKFCRGGENRDTYYVYRRMFSGLQERDSDRWLFVSGEEDIREAASKYLPHLEQDSFFELGI